MEDEKLGKLQLIKTRDWFLVEAHVPFELTKPDEIQGYEIYTFPPNDLLCSLPKDTIKGLRSVYNVKVRQEMLKLDFQPNCLEVSGSEKQTTVSVRKEMFEPGCFANYLRPDDDDNEEAKEEKHESFQIVIPLTNILAVVSICELMNASFKIACQTYNLPSGGHKADLFLFCESNE